MTVKNYVLDINKTSLQHPSIVLRQDDYNIYTINVSVTDNGTPVDLGSYTLNFLGITPAGAKIIDGDNFITTPADLAVGKFSYKFPKEAAGSKGVYDVAYFRLSTTSGATSTIDLNLRVLGGINLTADDVKDYITVNDALRNALVAEVFKKVDAKVDEHLATVKKGDKGDTGPAGKDGYMPIIGGRNYILNSQCTLSTQDPDVNHSGSTSWWYTNWVDTSIPISEFSNKVLTMSIQADYDNLTSVNAGARVGMEIVANEVKPDGTKTKRYLGNWHYVSEGESFHGRFSTTLDLRGITLESIYTPNHWAQGLYINGIIDTNDLNVSVSNPKLEIGNVATDWTPAPEDVPSNDPQLVHKTGNETIAGDKTFTGDTTLPTTTILAGNYGLRVTSSGVQKTTDGKNWVSANI